MRPSVGGYTGFDKTTTPLFDFDFRLRLKRECASPRRVCRGIATQVRSVRSYRHLIPCILPFSPPSNHRPHQRQPAEQPNNQRTRLRPWMATMFKTIRRFGAIPLITTPFGYLPPSTSFSIRAQASSNDKAYHRSIFHPADSVGGGQQTACRFA